MSTPNSGTVNNSKRISCVRKVRFVVGEPWRSRVAKDVIVTMAQWLERTGTTAVRYVPALVFDPQRDVR